MKCQVLCKAKPLEPERPEIVLSRGIYRFSAGPWPALTGWRVWVWRAFTLVIPKANPDFEGRYEHVTSWWLEVGDDGLVHREIGFDAGGQALVAAPFRQNHGIFTDLDSAPEPLGDLVEPAEFEQVWSAFHQSHHQAYAAEVAQLWGQWRAVVGCVVALIAVTWILSALMVLPPGTVVFIATCGALATLILITVGFKCPRCGSPLEIARARGIPTECDVCHLRFRRGLE